MGLVGYTEEEERQIVEIVVIQDGQALALAKEDFTARTGKEFPEVVPKFNPGDFNAWVNGCFEGGYRPRGRRLF